MSTDIEDLQRIPPSSVVLVLGAGVSIFSTNRAPVSSWPGLLADGLEFCQSRRKIPASELEIARANLAVGKTDELIAVGDKITQCLGGTRGALYRNWLKAAFKDIRPARVDLLDAIDGLGVPVVTTNYDSLLEDVTGRPTITCNDSDAAAVNEFVAGARNGILHMHGFWDKPETIVLGARSYARLQSNATCQNAMRSLASTRTMVFVGFGGGFEDDSFESLRKWMVDVLGHDGGFHYILVRKAELSQIDALFSGEDWFRPVDYDTKDGDFEDLPGFLGSIWPSARGSGAMGIAAKRPAAKAPAPPRPNVRGSGRGDGTPAVSIAQVPPRLQTAERDPNPGVDLAQPFPSLASLAELAKKAAAASDDLTAATLKRRWKGTFLFASNANDASYSITVSAMAMLALSEVGHRAAQFVCDDVLAAREADGQDAGAWRAQGNTYCHVLNAAWAVFACLRTRPSCVRNLGNTIAWLVRQRATGRAGWGYIRKETSTPRAFYTAYVVNSLVEYIRCAETFGLSSLPPIDCVEVRVALREGLRFLTDESPGSSTADLLTWSRDPASTDLCLATTAMATHVLAKLDGIEKLSPAVRSQLPCIVRLLCNVLRDGPVPPASIEIGGQSVPIEQWPRFQENDPPYWYDYFTPVVNVTLIETARDLGLTDVPVALQAATRAVQWIILNVVKQADGLPGVPARPGDRRVAIWPTLQGIIILQRWLASLSMLVRQPKSLAAFQPPVVQASGATAK
jgi:hypothetical protein